MSLQITIATRDMTPKKPTTLGCNGSIHQLYHDRDSPIEINAIRLKQKGSEVFILSVDTLFVTHDLKTIIIDHLKPKIALQEDQVFIVASHTHYAPFLDRSKPNLGTVDPIYYDYFKRRLVVLIDDLMMQDGVDVDVLYENSETTGIAVSCRKKAWGVWKRFILRRSMRLFPNQDAPIDANIRLIQLMDKETKKCRAVLWNFTCHPVMYHSPKNLSAHFPGDIRTHIRKTLGDIPVLFLQGFSGDIRPYYTPPPRTWRQRWLARVNGQPGFQPFTIASYRQWVAKINTCIDTVLTAPQQPIGNLNLEIKQYVCALDHIWTKKTDQTITFHAIHLNDTTVILGVSAEVVSQYSLQLQRLFPAKTIIPVGCYGQVFGYWPTEQMLHEKGYEVTGFLKGFSLTGRFKPTLEQVFETGVTAVL